MINGLISGELRPGLDMVVHSLVTAYHVQHKRKAMEQPEQ